jgi:hypothetical protein
MAVSDTELNKKIKDAFKDYNDGAYKNEMKSPKHLKILGDAIKAYFEDKTEITYGWAAAAPPPASTPDPAVAFNSTVKFPAFDLTAATSLATLAALIQAAALSGVISHATGFTVAPGSFLAAAPLALPAQTQYAEDILYKAIAKPVCAWYLTCINPAPLAGAHGPYTGATTGMAVK